MQTITALKDTWLKRTTEQSQFLKDKDKVAIKKGDKLRCKILKTDGDHQVIELAQPQVGFHNWYIFGKHFDFEYKILPVPFYPQTDNYTQPDRTCNSSSCAMAAKYLGADITGDDDYLERVLALGDTTDHAVQTQVLANLGIKSEWHTTLDLLDIDLQLINSKPVVLGILHRGSDQNPTGGHMIVAIGKYEQGYICHDPYGTMLDGYSSDVYNGKNVKYSNNKLESRWLVEGSHSGWGRIFK
jgi:hypothetical protein